MLGSDHVAGAVPDVYSARVTTGELNEVPVVMLIGASGRRLRRRKRRGYVLRILPAKELGIGATVRYGWQTTLGTWGRTVVGGVRRTEDARYW